MSLTGHAESPDNGRWRTTSYGRPVKSYELIRAFETRKKAHAFAICIALIVSAVPSTRITRLRL
jgi:hypothetical protein